MIKKSIHPPKKEPKNIRLTIRLTGDEKDIIHGIQSKLSDSIRGQLNETQAVTAALRIAAEKLDVTPKR